MFQEAAALSSSIIEQLVDKNAKTNQDNCELGDMLESAAMILVQSSKELGRYSFMPLTFIHLLPAFSYSITKTFKTIVGLSFRVK